MSRRTLAALSALLIAASGLAACGKVGALEQPGPMFGKRAASEPATRSKEAQDPTQPVTTIDPRDRMSDTAPARTVPIEGQSPDPFGGAPRGSLPDPYSNPGQ